jgi:adenylate kinase family enzyme
LIEKLDIAYISVDELVRGEAVDGQTCVSLVKKEILRQDRQDYLVGGFPQNVDATITFEKTVCPAACLLWLDVPDRVSLDRCQEARPDDISPGGIKERVKAFHEISEPVYRLFDESRRAVKIDGNREANAVFADVENVVVRVLNRQPLCPADEEEESEPDASVE